MIVVRRTDLSPLSSSSGGLLAEKVLAGISAAMALLILQAHVTDFIQRRLRKSPSILSSNSGIPVATPDYLY